VDSFQILRAHPIAIEGQKYGFDFGPNRRVVSSVFRVDGEFQEKSRRDTQ